MYVGGDGRIRTEGKQKQRMIFPREIHIIMKFSYHEICLFLLKVQRILSKSSSIPHHVHHVRLTPRGICVTRHVPRIIVYTGGTYPI